MPSVEIAATSLRGAHTLLIIVTEVSTMDPRHEARVLSISLKQNKIPTTAGERRDLEGGAGGF
jgi:hypothetical protein